MVLILTLIGAAAAGVLWQLFGVALSVVVGSFLAGLIVVCAGYWAARRYRQAR